MIEVVKFETAHQRFAIGNNLLVTTPHFPAAGFITYSQSQSPIETALWCCCDWCKYKNENENSRWNKKCTNHRAAQQTTLRCFQFKGKCPILIRSAFVRWRTNSLSSFPMAFQSIRRFRLRSFQITNIQHTCWVNTAWMPRKQMVCGWRRHFVKIFFKKFYIKARAKHRCSSKKRQFEMGKIRFAIGCGQNEMVRGICPCNCISR